MPWWFLKVKVGGKVHNLRDYRLLMRQRLATIYFFPFSALMCKVHPPPVCTKIGMIDLSTATQIGKDSLKVVCQIPVAMGLTAGSRPPDLRNGLPK